MVYFTPSKVRFLSYNIHGDCRDRKEFFRYEAAMSMQKKEGCDMHSLPKEDAAQCRIEPTIQKRRIFRTAIRKSKKLAEWRKIRHRRPKMAENPPTYVPVLRYNIDVIRWMPQRFLCAVNCIRDSFPNEPAILRLSADCLGDQNWNQTSSKRISLIRTLKTEHSGLQVRWPMEGANIRRRDDGESRSDPRSAWTC